MKKAEFPHESFKAAVAKSQPEITEALAARDKWWLGLIQEATSIEDLREKIKEWIPNDIRVCTRCRRELNISDFSKRSNNDNRPRTECKDCLKERAAQYRKTEDGRLCAERYNQSLKKKQQRRRYLDTPQGKAVAAKCNHNRRTIIETADTTLTAEEWETIKKHYDYRCVYCGEKKPLTRDHIIPVSKGGQLTKENIVPACHSCNARKRNKPVLLQLLSCNTEQQLKKEVTGNSE